MGLGESLLRRPRCPTARRRSRSRSARCCRRHRAPAGVAEDVGQSPAHVVEIGDAVTPDIGEELRRREPSPDHQAGAGGQGRDDAGVESVAVEHGHGAVENVVGREARPRGHGQAGVAQSSLAHSDRLGRSVDPDVNSEGKGSRARGNRAEKRPRRSNVGPGTPDRRRQRHACGGNADIKAFDQRSLGSVIDEDLAVGVPDVTGQLFPRRVGLIPTTVAPLRAAARNRYSGPLSRRTPMWKGPSWRTRPIHRPRWPNPTPPGASSRWCRRGEDRWRHRQPGRAAVGLRSSSAPTIVSVSSMGISAARGLEAMRLGFTRWLRNWRPGGPAPARSIAGLPRLGRRRRRSGRVLRGPPLVS